LQVYVGALPPPFFVRRVLITKEFLPFFDPQSRVVLCLPSFYQLQYRQSKAADCLATLLLLAQITIQPLTSSLRIRERA